MAGNQEDKAGAVEGKVSAEPAGCWTADGEGAAQSVRSSHPKRLNGGSGPFRRKPEMKAGPSTS